MNSSSFIQKLLLNILIFVIVFMAFALIARIVMHLSYIDWQTTRENLNSIFRMYQYGFAYDLRIVTTALILPFLIGYLCVLFRIQEQGYFKFFAYLMGFYGGIFAFCYLVNYFYFQIYHTQIDIFIFGLVDDDTRAILEIAFKDYPLFWGILFVLSVGYLTYVFARKITQAHFLESYFISSPPPPYAFSCSYCS